VPGAPIAWTVALPLVAAAVIFVAPRPARPALAVIALGGIAVATALLLSQVVAAGPAVHLLGGWPSPLAITLRADGLSLFMLALSGVVGVLLTVHALIYLPVQRESQLDLGLFFPLWFLLWLGLSAVYLAGDLFNAYVALEVLGLSAVGLVALSGGEAVAAAMRYVLATLLASLLFLLGVALVYAQHGVVDMQALAAMAASGPATSAALAFMTLGLAMKTALFPLHFWLPAAHAGALAPISAVLSGLVVKASFYLLARLWLGVFANVHTPPVAELLGVLGIGAVIWGSVQAIRQERLKLLVAYSTVAQLGYLFLVFPLAAHPAGGAAAWRGGFLLVASHACAKAGMFLAAGTLKHVIGHDRVADARGLGVRAPLTVFTFALAGLTLVGLPPSGGFLAKWMLLTAAIDGGHVAIAITLVVGTGLAAAYVFPFLAHALRDPPEGGWRREPVSRALELPALVLSLAGVFLGLFSRAPLALLDIGRPWP
jgi:multicomponent Na+:H+ antiporter subunit D